MGVIVPRRESCTRDDLRCLIAFNCHNMSVEKNVEYILVAEFDIDKGSTINFQYPEPTGEDTQ